MDASFVSRLVLNVLILHGIVIRRTEGKGAASRGGAGTGEGMMLSKSPCYILLRRYNRICIYPACFKVYTRCMITVSFLSKIRVPVFQCSFSLPLKE